MILEFLSSNIEHFSYLGIAVLIGLTSIGAPFPEEAVLLLAGYFVFIGIVKLKYTILFALIGVLIGDNIAYYIGFKKGADFFKLLGRRFKIIGRNINRVLRFFHEHHNKSIFFGRFLMGIRFLVPFMAGSLKIPPRKFFFYNFLGAIIWIPLVIIIGYRLGALLDIGAESKKLKQTVYLVLVLILILYKITVWLRTKYYESFKAKNKEEEGDTEI